MNPSSQAPRLIRASASPSHLRPWLGVALLAMLLPAAAGELYQWKDTKGVTHYSDAPPPGRSGYQTRTIRDSRVPVAAKPAESAQCMTARMNLEHLRGNQPVGFDGNGDGKPDSTLTAEQRTEQTRKAEETLQRVCAAVASTGTPDASGTR